MSDSLNRLRAEYDRLAAIVPKLTGDEQLKVKEQKRQAFARWWDADQAAKNAPPKPTIPLIAREKPVPIVLTTIPTTLSAPPVVAVEPPVPQEPENVRTDIPSPATPPAPVVAPVADNDDSRQRSAGAVRRATEGVRRPARSGTDH